MGMTREARASSTRSNNNSSIVAAVREKTEKFAPPATSVAPIGKLRPVVRTETGCSVAEMLAAGVAVRELPAANVGAFISCLGFQLPGTAAKSIQNLANLPL